MGDFGDFVFLFVMATVGGAINAIAGGGMLVVFPTLIAFGVPPLSANATSTVALLPGSIAATFGYRRPLSAVRTVARNAILPAVVGGAAGALLLNRTSAATFRGIVPWFVLGATLLFALQERIVAFVLRALPPERRVPWRPEWVQLVLAVYWGYFGAGAGILMMAVWGLAGIKDVQELNALKMWSAVWTNGTAAILFALSGLVDWRAALLMTLGSAAGGYGLARLAQHLSQRVVRNTIVVIGLGSAIWLMRR
jgi:uncharacterized membrane protein YfcA